MTASRIRRTAPALVLLLALTGCAGGASGEPSEAPTVSTSQAPSAEAMADAGSATSAPPETAGAPDAGDEALAGWRTIATSDGIFRWRIPADWSVVDESFEAEDGLGHVNSFTVVSDIGQELAFFGSAYYGDRGGACDDWDGDGTIMVPAQLHFDDPTALRGAGRVVAYTSERQPGVFDFYAGYTLDEVEADRVPCLRYSDVPVDDERLHASFGTTFDPTLWNVPSFEQGAAYAETEEFRELIEMFRSLEVLEVP